MSRSVKEPTLPQVKVTSEPLKICEGMKVIVDPDAQMGSLKAESTSS